MGEREGWLDQEGPASVKRLLEALREEAAPAAGGADRMARVMGSFLANVEHWMARAREEAPVTERPSDVTRSSWRIRRLSRPRLPRPRRCWDSRCGRGCR